jgi:hypothetical protein
VCLSDIVLTVGIRVKVYLAGRSKAKASSGSEKKSSGMHCERRW